MAIGAQALVPIGVGAKYMMDVAEEAMPCY